MKSLDRKLSGAGKEEADCAEFLKVQIEMSVEWPPPASRSMYFSPGKGQWELCGGGVHLREGARYFKP